MSNFLSEAEIASYVSSPVADASYEGVAYGVPFWHGPILPYANTTLQEMAGLAPGAVEDIHAYRDQIAKIGSLGTDSEGRNIIGFSLRNVKSANAAFWFTPWLWAWGGELVDADNNATLDTDEFRQALEFYAWMTNSGYSAKGMDPYNTRIVFGERRAGFVFDGPWLRGMLRTLTEDPTIDDAYQVIPMPRGVTGENWTIANPTVLVVFESSKNKEAGVRVRQVRLGEHQRPQRPVQQHGPVAHRQRHAGERPAAAGRLRADVRRADADEPRRAVEGLALAGAAGHPGQGDHRGDRAQRRLRVDLRAGAARIRRAAGRVDRPAQAGIGLPERTATQE